MAPLYETQDDSVQNEVKTEIAECPNCKNEVSNSTICPICGYPLNLNVPRLSEPDDSDEYYNETASIQQDSEEIGEEKLDEVTWEDTYSSEPIKQGFSSKEEIKQEEEVDSRHKKSTSFFGGFERFFGRNTFHKSEDKDQENVTSQEIDPENQPQPIDKVEFTVNDEMNKESAEVTVGEIDHDIDGHIIMEIPITEVLEVPRVVESYPNSNPQVSPQLTNHANPRLKEIQEGLLQCFSLKLWLVDMLHRGDVDEELFTKMFDEYESQEIKLTKYREEALDRESDIKSLEKSLSKAKVYLEELRLKREIGKISEEEYEAKAPAYEWDINHYKEEISECKGEIEFLKDLTMVIPRERIIEIITRLEKCRNDMDDMVQIGTGVTETISRVKKSLDRTIDFLEKHKINYY